MSTEPVQIAPPGSGIPGADKKLVAGLLGILLGGLGVHKFYLGYTKEGLIMLLGTLCTCGIAGIVIGPIGLIEGILYLAKSDEEFLTTYVNNKRGWF
ncbi:TM2 domain-containing protein [Luteolibacter yonseiensis]|uniref:TM2 domain-containing protein n=1 Tax=Luteolibacter yonseiensis TaxID=1144680 RepID=A0A934R4N7_9BACT|nr:NINE protein [Luteolibacter yonseiensis]MBK1816317.1 TM2 domain-containing protein [Luteolibacter yonseiensis]